MGMVAAGLGEDLLLANETLDPARLTAMASLQDQAVDHRCSRLTRDHRCRSVGGPEVRAHRRQRRAAAVRLRPERGRPSCRLRTRSSAWSSVASWATRAISCAVVDRTEQRDLVAEAMDRLIVASLMVGGDIISAGGTGTYDLHDQVNEIQAGSYALMDTDYGGRGHPFKQACFILTTVISSNPEYAVGDAGLKTHGMDHGNPSIDGATVRFLSDEHVTFVPTTQMEVGAKVKMIPAHIDPTMAMHEVAWLTKGDEVIESWPIDLRGW